MHKALYISYNIIPYYKGTFGSYIYIILNPLEQLYQNFSKIKSDIL